MNDNTIAEKPSVKEIILAAPPVRAVRDWSAWMPDLGLRGLLVLVIVLFAAYGIGYYKGWSRRGADFAVKAQALAEKVIAAERAKIARDRADLDALRTKLDAERARLEAADTAAARAAETLGDEVCFTAEELRKIRGQ